MNMNTTFNMTIKGIVTPFIRKDGIDTPIGGLFNAIQSTGPEAVANALAYGRKLSQVWFLHSSSSSPASMGASGGTLTINDFMTRGAASGMGLMACTAYAVGVAKDGPNSTDAATFLSVTPGSVKAGASFSNGRYVYAVGLVQSTDEGDVLYAACDLTPIAKAANSQIGVRWQTSITIS